MTGVVDERRRAVLHEYAARRRAIRQARDDTADPLAFGSRYLGESLNLPPGPHHRWLANRLDPDGPTGVRAFCGAPRGSGKSTVTLSLLPLVALVRRSHRFIVVLRRVDTDARDAVEALYEYLQEDPHGLVDRYPWLRPVHYADGELRVRHAIVVARGAQSKAVRGLLRRVDGRQTRPDLVLFDDIEDDEQARSKLRTDRLERWLLGPVAQLGGPPGEEGSVPLDVVGIGTTLATGSLAVRLLERRDRFAGWQVARFPAEYVAGSDGAALAPLNSESTPVPLPELTAPADATPGQRVAMWPEGMPLDYLARLTTPGGEDYIGSVMYAQEYLLSPVADEDRKVDEGWLRYCDLDGDRIVGRDPETGDVVVDVPFRKLYRTLALDPAFGLKEKSDRSALVAAAADGDGNYFILAAWAGREREGKVLDELDRLAYRWDVAEVGVESVAAQVVMARWARRRGHVVKPLTHKGDKGVRIGTLGALYEAGQVWHVRGAEGLVEYEAELTGFPVAEHDDLPDAGEMAVRLARTRRRRARIVV